MNGSKNDEKAMSGTTLVNPRGVAIDKLDKLQNEGEFAKLKQDQDKQKLILSRVNQLVNDKRDLLSPTIYGATAYRSQTSNRFKLYG